MHNPTNIYHYHTDITLEDQLLPYYNARFVGMVHFDCEYRYIEGDIEILGDIKMNIAGSCDRCGQDANISCIVPIDELYIPIGQDEQDCYYYSGNKLDLYQMIIDNILLNLPTSLLCVDNCQGLCLRCGIDLNKDKCNCT